MICLSLGVGSLGVDIGGEIPAWLKDAADSHRRRHRFPSDLVTRQSSRARFPQPIRGLPARSSLVTLRHRIPYSHQQLAPLSSLVTDRHLSAILAHIWGSSRATPARDSRAAPRKSSSDFPASLASAVGSPSCSPPDKAMPNKTSAASASADGGETVAGSAGIDVVYSSSQGLRILLAPYDARAPRSPD